ncbi:MAG: DUF927 domain-containing protein [Holophagales bacterium]|nr:DUF927 domain-containing protein [Holophagales bacterium]
MKVNSKMVKCGLATIVKDDPVVEVAEDSATPSTGLVEVKVGIVEDCINVGNFFMRPTGLWLEVPDSKNEGVIVKGWISEPFDVEGVAYDAVKNNPHFVVTFRVKQYHKNVMVPTELIFKPIDLACKLNNHGLSIAPGAVDYLPSYFSLIRKTLDKDIELAYSCGWQVNGVFMLPSGKRCGNDKELVWPSSELQGSLVEQSKSGIMRGQKEAMKLICNNPWFQFCLGVALAGALAKPTGSRSVGFHIWSKSSRGKSIAAELAASVWQKPDPLQNWRSTANALEGLAIRHNDGFMVLDEIQTVDTANALDEASYLLANGKQKARCNADSTLKKIRSWNIVYLSTGEYDYATALKRKSSNRIQQTQSGQEVRLISIHAPETDMGLVSNFAVHGFGSSKEYVERIRELARGNFGHIGEAYAEMLAEAVQKDFDGFRAECLQSMDAWKAKAYSGGNQVNRILDSFALVACAGKLATDKGILPWGENDAFEACWMVYKAFLEDRASGIDGEDLKNLKSILKILQTEGNRFAAPGCQLNSVPNCLGRLVNSGRNEDGETIYDFDFTSEGLQEVCECDIKRIIATLKAQGWLVLTDKGENQHHTKLKKKQWRFYRIRHEKVREFEDSLNPMDIEAEVKADADAGEGQDD